LQWESVAQILAKHLVGGVWIVGWPTTNVAHVNHGLNKNAFKPIKQRKQCFHPRQWEGWLTQSLMHVLAQAHAEGNLQLAVGDGGAGLSMLKALRLLRSNLKNGMFSTKIHGVILSPSASAGPLRISFGDAYPMKLARLQLLGWAVYRLFRQMGVANLLTSMSDATESDFVAAWWLSYFDPVSSMGDVVREILLAGALWIFFKCCLLPGCKDGNCQARVGC